MLILKIYFKGIGNRFAAWRCIDSHNNVGNVTTYSKKIKI